jgi:hypothetical protein
VANNKDPNQKQPGEKKPGKFHYNPGNMSGKPIKGKDESERKSNADRMQRRDKQERQKP